MNRSYPTLATAIAASGNVLNFDVAVDDDPEVEEYRITETTPEGQDLEPRFFDDCYAADRYFQERRAATA